MSTADLEKELARWRDPAAADDTSNALALSVEDALAYRDAGNLPDEEGRTLRLVLFARDLDEVRALGRKRLEFEPDYHSAPRWRREGSVPVNVVPLRSPGVAGDPSPWWESREMAELESEWRSTGRVAGLAVPAAYRGFVLKTVVALREAGVTVDRDSVASSLARWLSPEQVREITDAMRAATRSQGSEPEDLGRD
ncbi:MAG TPA: hypothetical protein VHN37_09205 [Actinomycetota bacterium]|nr:hypothetical protein [Actinomycetota bacterium]